MAYNKQLADRAVAFINSLKHTKGTWHGVPFKLLPWQNKIICDVFGTVKDNGYRQYNTAYIEIPKSKEKARSRRRSRFIFWRATESGVRKCMDAPPTDSRQASCSMWLAIWWSNARHSKSALNP